MSKMKPILNTTLSLLIEPRLGSVVRLEIDQAKLRTWKNKMALRDWREKHV